MLLIKKWKILEEFQIIKKMKEELNQFLNF